ncbi:MAG: isochorismatase [Phormidesmis sp.]
MSSIPSFFNLETVGKVWRVPYQTRASEAQAYAKARGIAPSYTDKVRICLLAIDVQNTFCLPDFELFVGGRSGNGAVEDTQRLCEFIYRNLGILTEIAPTMDTHAATQIFHPVFWVNAAGEHPAPMTMISAEEIASGQWRVNPVVAKSLAQIQLGTDPIDVAAFALHYAKELGAANKYPLTIWPYHSMLGGIGHALVPAFEEACFFHNMARQSQTHLEIKGDNPLTENYSALSPEVLNGTDNQPIAQKNNSFVQHLLGFDAVIIAGQAKSHCVAWTIRDLLSEIQAVDPALAGKVYLLEDCASPVVVPEVVDFTDAADACYRDFAAAGMHVVKSIQRPQDWPAFPLRTD